jgi:hypothetical protein
VDGHHLIQASKVSNILQSLMDTIGRQDILRSFMVEVQSMLKREDARRTEEKERELEESERALEEMGESIGQLDDGDEDILDLAVEVMEKYDGSTIAKQTRRGSATGRGTPGEGGIEIEVTRRCKRRETA